MTQGQLAKAGSRWTLTFSRWVPHPPEKVWRALTEPEHLEAWFPTTIEGELVAGAQLLFSHRDDAAPPSRGEMIAFEPPRLLEFTWGDGDRLRFELKPEQSGTGLTLVDTFDEQGKAARDAAGWHACLDALVAHLSGDAIDATQRWREVHDGYVERFGPDAATIGPPVDHPVTRTG
jgi:uncharacterized protein YndB with AHSA1/START domain